MQKLKIESLLSSAHNLGQVFIQGKLGALPSKDLKIVLKAAEVIEARCILLDLNVSAISATRLKRAAEAIKQKIGPKPPAQLSVDHSAKIVNVIRELSSRLADELKGRLFLAIPQSAAVRYGQTEPLFGPEVHSKFPMAQFEIDEAGKCMALERATAAVFHLMRTLEIGILAIARSLGIQYPTNGAERNWGVVLQKIAAAMAEKRNARSWQARDEDFFSEAYALLNAVRNVWRNATMHVETKYTPEEAEHIFQAVQSFMKKLASRLDEQGQPLA